jgi:hypothetical protein
MLVVKILIFFIALWLIYQFFVASELVEGFGSYKILTNIDNLTEMQQQVLHGSTNEFRRVLKAIYNGNIDDISIEKKKEINKLASTAATNLKNALMNTSEDKYREAGFPISRQFVSDISNLMGKDVDTTKISWGGPPPPPPGNPPPSF